MKCFVLIFSIACICFSIKAQERFIKTNTRTDFGSAIRILPTDDKGWVVISLDSLHMSKFDKCGRTEWSKKFPVPNENVSLTDIIKSKLGGFILLTRMFNGTYYECLVTRIDDSGNIAWCKSYGDNTYDHYGYTINEDSQGNVVIFANMSIVNGPGYNMLIKLNYAGNIIWTKLYDHGGIWGGAIITSDDGNLVRTGSFFYKTDVNGNLEWTSIFQIAGTYNYYAPIEVSDGYIFTSTGNTSYEINFCKIDRLGNVSSVGRKKSNFSGKPPELCNRSNGNFAGVFTKNNLPTIVEFDKDLNVLYQSSIDFPGLSLFVNDICFNQNGEAIVAGFGGANMFYAKTDALLHTQCDASLPKMNLTSDSVFFLRSSTTVQPYNLIAVNHQYQSLSLQDSQTTRCTVPLQLELGNNISVCRSDNFILRNNLVGLFDEYNWSNGETSPFISVDHSGTYWVTAKHYCEDSVVTDTIVIDVDPSVPFDFGNDIFECESNAVTLHAPSCNSCTYLWNDGSIADSMKISNAGNYWLRVKNDNNCYSADSVSVDFLKCECDFYVPNAFTPNNDGSNELFMPAYYCDIRGYDLKIFDRWGKLIYGSINIDEGWNGTYNGEKVPHGVYNYLINYDAIVKGNMKSSFSKNGFVVVLY